MSIPAYALLWTDPSKPGCTPLIHLHDSGDRQTKALCGVNSKNASMTPFQPLVPANQYCPRCIAKRDRMKKEQPCQNVAKS